MATGESVTEVWLNCPNLLGQLSQLENPVEEDSYRAPAIYIHTSEKKCELQELSYHSKSLLTG